MAIKQKKDGFALLVAVIFMSVMLSFALAIGALAFKQVTLASSAVESQYAFYAADAALECVLFYDQNPEGSLFEYGKIVDKAAPDLKCGQENDENPATIDTSSDKSLVRVSYRFEFNSGAHYCADITVYKYKDPQLPTNYSTYLFAQGYNTSCAGVHDVETGAKGARHAARGLQAAY